MPGINSLKGGEIYFAHSFMSMVKARQKRGAHIMAMGPSPFASFIPFRLLNRYSSHSNPFWKRPHRHSQRSALLIYWTLLNPIKLIIKIDHHSSFSYHFQAIIFPFESL
jgi:hypothetical protein